MAHVVFRNDKIAKTVQIFGKAVIPLGELGDSVDDLYNGFWLSLRGPAACMDLPDSLGVIIEIGTHGDYSTTV